MANQGYPTGIDPAVWDALDKKIGDWKTVFFGSHEEEGSQMGNQIVGGWEKSPYVTGAMNAAGGMERSANYFEKLKGGWTAENVLQAHPVFAKFYNATNSETLAKMMNTGTRNFGMRQSADIYKDVTSAYTGLSSIYSGILGQAMSLQMEGKSQDAAENAAGWKAMGDILGLIIGQG